MAVAAFGVGGSAMRRWTLVAGAEYSASDVENVQGPAAIGTAKGKKLLSSPHSALE